MSDSSLSSLIVVLIDVRVFSSFENSLSGSAVVTGKVGLGLELELGLGLGVGL